MIIYICGMKKIKLGIQLNKKFNNPSWNLYLDKVYSYAYWDNAFSKAECETIISIAKSKGFIGGETTGKSKARSSKFC